MAGETTNLTKTAPSASGRIIIDRDGIYAAIDVDGDWIVNRAGVAVVAHVVHDYTRGGVQRAAARPAADRYATLAAARSVGILRCAGLSAYLIMGGPALAYRRRTEAGLPVCEQVEELDKIVGAAEAEAATVGWTHLAFLRDGGAPLGGIHLRV